jgi:hypothetical protein
VAGKPQRSGTEWIGTDTARANASTPIVDAPEAAVTGSAVSKLEEVPSSLRGSRAVRSEASVVPGQGPGMAPSELSPRRSTSHATQPAVNHPVPADDGQKIVTDEEAFSVETPGGGVLAKAQTTRSYRVEPPMALGGGN